MSLEPLLKKLLKQKKFTKKNLQKLKRQWAKKNGDFPKNSEILQVYKNLLKKDKIPKNKKLEKFLRIRKIRSLSGIVPVAVLTKPYPCPGNCIYCPTQKGTPKSYLDDEPAVMRAVMAGYDPYLQVKRRLNQLKKIGHPIDKIELIVMGGTFSWLPKKYQKNFIAQCFAAANGIKKPTPQELEQLGGLAYVQKINEKAKNRIIGITLETRPDQITEKEIKQMRLLGGTRVEIGVQSIYDEILEKVNRGHGVQETVKATQLLKDAGFKICYHMMPNLPGSDLQKDLQMFKKIYSDPRFIPDMVKIYPCVVTYQAELYDWYKQGRYKPYPDKKLIKLLTEIKKITPEWVRINRLGRDIPINNIAAGFKISNIRQVLQNQMAEKGLKCRCIRCREIRKRNSLETQLEKTVLKASQGKEFFLQYVDKKRNLYALLRLRFPSYHYNNKKHFLKELQGCAIIRELHTYGQAVPIQNYRKKAVQHQGFGKKLIQEAEKISREEGFKKIAVISAVGTREYYRKLGYRLKESYMIKTI